MHWICGKKNLENEKIIAKENFSKLYDKLTANQKNIFNKLTNFPSDKPYFIDRPGGSGKTFLYKTWWFPSNFTSC